MVAERLDALRAEFDGLTAVAYADLSINMVLVTNTGASMSREMLDALCIESDVTLGSSKLAGLGSGPFQAAFTATPDQSKVFVRDTSEPNDVLFCLCDPAIDMTTFLPAVQTCLSEISGGTS